MPSPFPGMDPYLEHPTLWHGVHNGLIAALQLSLAPRLRPCYYVALEDRLYITEPDQRVFVGRPDVAVAEADAPTVVGGSLEEGLRQPFINYRRVPTPLLAFNDEEWSE